MKKIKYFLILIFIFLFQIKLSALHFPLGASIKFCKKVLYTRYSNVKFLKVGFTNDMKYYAYMVDFANRPTVITLFYTNNRLFAYTFSTYLPYSIEAADAALNSLKKHYGKCDILDMVEFEYIDMTWIKEDHIFIAYLDFLIGYPEFIGFHLLTFPLDKDYINNLKKIIRNNLSPR